MTLKTIEEVKELVGKNTTLKFHFLSDNIINYYSVIPLKQLDTLISYNVQFFYESGVSFFEFDNFDNFLNDLKVFRLIEVNEETKEQTLLFEQKYKEKI